MKSLNPRIKRLQELMALEEKRHELQQQLGELVDRMSALRDALFEESNNDDENKSASATRSSSSGATSPVRGRGKGRRGGRTPRGELKNQIVAALTSAGEKGLRVVDLAKNLGIKAVNVHSWFHSAQRRFPQIKKMERGQYRLDGSVGGGEESSSEPKTGKRGRPKAVKAARSSASTSKKASRRSPRGALSERILSELQSAGAKGVNVRDLAEKIGAPYRNIYIWFATTGKKNGKVKKVAPATYKLA